MCECVNVLLFVCMCACECARDILHFLHLQLYSIHYHPQYDNPLYMHHRTARPQPRRVACLHMRSLWCIPIAMVQLLLTHLVLGKLVALDLLLPLLLAEGISGMQGLVLFLAHLARR
jgi:hypothetical protein